VKRREFITLLGGAAVVWPLAARAQQQPVRPLIGVLSPLSAASAARNIAGFRSGLRDPMMDRPRRLERLPGGTCTHWKAPPCHGAHPTRTLGMISICCQG